MSKPENQKPAMEKFYFTYGTDSRYPFQGGWTLIYADNLLAAQQIFKAYHPNRPGCDCLNCADFYTAERFEKSEAFKTGNLGARCHEILFMRTPEAEAFAAMLMRKAMCEACDADLCAFEDKGICKFPMVYGKPAVYDDHYGCRGFVEKPDTCRPAEEI